MILEAEAETLLRQAWRVTTDNCVQRRINDLLRFSGKMDEGCDHRDWTNEKHGRFCYCGVQIWDAGD